MIANFGPLNPREPGKIRQIVESEKAEVPDTQAPIKRLLEEIGVYDSHELPPDYAPPKGDFGRGLLIRGGQGSHWLNRLSALTMILLLTIIAGFVIGGVKVLQQFGTPEPVTINCSLPANTGDVLNVPDQTGRRALRGNPRPPVLGDMSGVAAGQVIVPPKTGQVSLSADGSRTNLLPTALGQMRVVSRSEQVQQVEVSFETPPGLCASLQATGLIGTSQITLQGSQILGTGLLGWQVEFEGSQEEVKAVRLNRAGPLTTKD